MADRWKDGDPTDTGVPVDSDYLSPDSKPNKDVVTGDLERVTDGGQAIYDGPSNTQESQRTFTDKHGDVEGIGANSATEARTTADFDSVRLWKLHSGHDVLRAKDDWAIPYLNRENKTLRGMAQQVVENEWAVNLALWLVQTDERSNTFNRHHHANRSRLLGYLGLIYGNVGVDPERVTAETLRENEIDVDRGVSRLMEIADSTLGLDKDELKYDVEYAKERFD